MSGKVEKLRFGLILRQANKKMDNNQRKNKIWTNNSLFSFILGIIALLGTIYFSLTIITHRISYFNYQPLGLFLISVSSYFFYKGLILLVIFFGILFGLAGLKSQKGGLAKKGLVFSLLAFFLYVIAVIGIFVNIPKM